MSGGGSGGGGNTTTVQKADPWAGIQPYLSNMYQTANNTGNGAFMAYPGQQVADFNASQRMALGRADNRSYGSPLEAQAQQRTSDLAAGHTQGQDALSNIVSGLGLSGQLNNLGFGMGAGNEFLKSTLNSNYLSGDNPALQAAMTAANSNTTRNFQTAVMPGLASQFSLAGRYGSGAQSQGVSDATNNLATQMSNTNSSMALQDLQQRRALQSQNASSLNSTMLGASTAGVNAQNQAGANMNATTLAATGMLPGMANIDWNNIQKQAAVGDTMQQQEQAVRDNQAATWNQNNQAGVNRLSWMNSILNGGMSLNGSTQTQSGNRSGFASALSGGMGGVMSGAMMGSVFPGIGTGMGAALGGGLGLLSGLF